MMLKFRQNTKEKRDLLIEPSTHIYGGSITEGESYAHPHDAVSVSTNQERTSTSLFSSKEDPAKIYTSIPEVHQRLSNTFDPLRTPPILNLAEFHWSCNGFGQETSQKRDRGNTCPCCQKKLKSEFPLAQNPRKIRGQGRTVPLFFQLFEFLTFLVLVSFVAFAAPGYQKIHLYCQYLKDNGSSCQTFGFYMFYKYSNDFVKKHGQDLSQIYQRNLTLSTGCAFLCVLAAGWFRVRQYRLEAEFEREENTASQYTLLVENIVIRKGLKDGEAEKKLRKFFEKLMVGSGQPHVRVFKISFVGLDMWLRDLDEKMERVERQMKGIEELKISREDQQFEEKKRKVKERYQELKETAKETFGLRRRLEKVRMSNGEQPSRLGADSERLIALVTLFTKDDVSRILSAYNSYSSCSGWLACGCCFKRGFDMTIKPAPEPKDVEWTNCSISSAERSAKVGTGSVVVSILLIGSLIMLKIGFQAVVPVMVKNEFPEAWVEGYVNLTSYILIWVFMTTSPRVFDLTKTYSRSLTKSEFKNTKAVVLMALNIVFVCVNAFFNSMFRPCPKSMHRMYFEISAIFQGFFSFIAFQAVFGPFLVTFNISFFMKELKKIKISKILKTGKFDAEKMKDLNQLALNRLFDRPSANLEIKYSLVVSFSILSVLMNFILPMTSILGALYLTFAYYSERTLFYRRYAAPENFGKIHLKMFRASLLAQRLLPLQNLFIIVLGWLFYQRVLIVYLFMNSVLLFAPIEWISEVFYSKSKAKDLRESQTFDRVSGLVKVDYENENPVDLLRAENMRKISFLRDIEGNYESSVREDSATLHF